MPVNAPDTGSIPGPGRFHLLRAAKPMHHTTEPWLWSPCGTTTELTLPRDHGPQQEKPLQ